MQAALLWVALLGAPMPREETRREAERLATEADALQNKAWHRRYHDAADPSLPELNRSAADRYRTALEIWRALGDRNHVLLATEKLGAVIALTGDDDSAAAFFTKEIADWSERKDIDGALRLMSKLGSIQRATGRREQARRTFEDLAAASHAANQRGNEAGALHDLGLTLDVLGRKEEAARVHAEAHALTEELRRTRPQWPARAVPVPAQWLELPDVPVTVHARTKDGVEQARLVNRTAKRIHRIDVGCAGSVQGIVHVSSVLRGSMAECDDPNDPELPVLAQPGEDVQMLFESLHQPANAWTDDLVSCPGGERMIVTRVTFTDRTSWTAEGAPWPRP